MVTKCPLCVGLWGCLSVAGVWTLRKQDCRDNPCCPCSGLQFIDGKPEARPDSAAGGEGSRRVLASAPGDSPFTSMARAPWGFEEETACCPTRPFSQPASRTRGPQAWLCSLVCAPGFSGPQFLHLERESGWVSCLSVLSAQRCRIGAGGRELGPPGGTGQSTGEGGEAVKRRALTSLLYPELLLGQKL